MNLNAVFADLVTKLEGWLAALILMLPNFVAAALVVLVAAVVARLVRRAVYGVLRRTSSYATVNHLLASVAYAVALGVGVFTALGILQLDTAVTSLLAGVGIVGLALGFAFQDLASNFIAGVLLSIRRPFVEGDLIAKGDYMGTVTEINLRSTKLHTLQGQTVIIPNANVFTEAVVNYSTGERRVDLECGVAYGDDLEQAREVALQAIRALPMVRQDRPVDLHYEGFGDSSIDFTLRFWIAFERQPDFLSARSEAIIALKKAFDEAGITIPFPIRTLDFGVVGGERLDEVLPRRFYEDNGEGRA
jgi:small conductance mechanosensitive channel